MESRQIVSVLTNSREIMLQSQTLQHDFEYPLLFMATNKRTKSLTFSSKTPVRGNNTRLQQVTQFPAIYER